MMMMMMIMLNFLRLKNESDLTLKYNLHNEAMQNGPKYDKIFSTISLIIFYPASMSFTLRRLKRITHTFRYSKESRY